MKSFTSVSAANKGYARENPSERCQGQLGTYVQTDADVIVVGGGPAGATAAYHLAAAGLDVLVLEKSSYPREKVCGDGLTPRAVAQLLQMGVDVTAPGWFRTKGLRVIGAGTRLDIDWPELAEFPNYGLTRTRADFDQLLIDRAMAAGAVVQQDTAVAGPLLDTAGRVTGVTTPDRDYRATLVVAADGVSGRFPLSLGLARHPTRPVGVAVRRYYQSPRHNDSYLETWHSIPVGDGMLAGYGWIFPMGDGRCNVGIGALNVAQQHDYRRILDEWLTTLPESWGLVPANADGPTRGAGLPMAFNRKPHYTRGMMLVGDSGGLVNPFTGEGIAYAMESGFIAGKLAALALRRRRPGPDRERVLRGYSATLRNRWGGYYRLGSWFANALGRPEMVRFALRHGFTRPALLQAGFRVLTNLTDPRRGRSRVLDAVCQLVPSA